MPTPHQHVCGPTGVGALIFAAVVFGLFALPGMVVQSWALRCRGWRWRAVVPLALGSGLLSVRVALPFGNWMVFEGIGWAGSQLLALGPQFAVAIVVVFVARLWSGPRPPGPGVAGSSH